PDGSLRPKERSAFRVLLSLGGVPPDNLRIAAGRCKHMPPVSQFDRYRARRNRQNVLQDCSRCVCITDASLVSDPHRDQTALALIEAKLGAPTKDHAGYDVVPPANRCGADTWLLSLHHDREFFGVRETAPVRAAIARRISWRFGCQDIFAA